MRKSAVQQSAARHILCSKGPDLVQPSSESPHPPPRRLAARRGFTLLELLTVVVIISVFAALSIPQVTRQLRDRRIHETAQRIAHLYRQARLRAVGQGGAVLFRYTAGTNGQGKVEILEALVGAPAGTDPTQCAQLPSPSCRGTNWTSTGAGGQARLLTTLDLGTEAWLDNAYMTLTGHPPNDNGAKTSMNICFTPLGRTFVSYDGAVPNPAFTTLNGVPVASVFRTDGGGAQLGRVRQVLFLPSGMARLAL